MRERGRNKKKD